MSLIGHGTERQGNECTARKPNEFVDEKKLREIINIIEKKNAMHTLELIIFNICNPKVRIFSLCIEAIE